MLRNSRLNPQPNRYFDSDGAPQTLAEGEAAARANAIAVAAAGGANYTQEERAAAAGALKNGA